LNLNRLPNECFIDYADRLINNKQNYDLDHTEIYELLFNTVMSSTESRKRLYGVKETIEQLKKEGFENLTEDEIFLKLENKKIELQKEKVKLSTLRNDLNKLIRDNSRRELILEEVLRIIPKVDKVEFNPLITQDKNRDYLLCISDIHYSSFFTSQNNEYSVDIVKERFEILLGELIKFVNKEKINKLYISNNGDSIQGIIRISDLKKNQLGLLESVISFSRFMGDFLNELSKHVNIEYYHVPNANHADIRLFDEKRNQTGENLEYLIVNYIHDYLKENERIIVHIPKKDFIEFELQGYNIISMHGDEVKNIKTILEKISMRNRKFYDYVILGHFHSTLEQTVYEGETNNMEILITPSIVGSCPYSDSLMVGSKSSAKLHIFEKDKGRIQSNNFILN